MTKLEAEKLAKQNLNIIKNEDGYDMQARVKYNGEIITLTFNPEYEPKGQTTIIKDIITELSTCSTKFRTKSGVGVGSTRDELFNDYKDFPRFEMYSVWESGKRLANEKYFVLKDEDAATSLSFKLVNNVVTEVSIYRTEGEGW